MHPRCTRYCLHRLSCSSHQHLLSSKTRGLYLVVLGSVLQVELQHGAEVNPAGVEVDSACVEVDSACVEVGGGRAGVEVFPARRAIGLRTRGSARVGPSHISDTGGVHTQGLQYYQLGSMTHGKSLRKSLYLLSLCKLLLESAKYTCHS